MNKFIYMKKSGIFWSVLIIGILYYLFNIDILTFLIGYLVFCVIGLIIQNTSEFTILTKTGRYKYIDDDEDIDIDKLKELFLNKSYLFLIPHLFVLGFVIGFWSNAINIGKYLSSFNDRIDNIKIRKEKKKTFNEFKKSV